MGSSAFTLIYDLLHDANAATNHLPWVYASLQLLSTMRVGDPITSTISAIQTVLRNINPSYEWSPYQNSANYPHETEGPMIMAQSHNSLDSQQSDFHGQLYPRPSPLGPYSDLSTAKYNLPQLENPETGASGGSNEDLLDITQSDMGWDLNFSTMDLEAFFSVRQPADTSLS